VESALACVTPEMGSLVRHEYARQPRFLGKDCFLSEHKISQQLEPSHKAEFPLS